MRCPAPNSVLRSVSSCQSDIKMPLCSGGLVQGRKVLSPAPELRPPVKAARMSSDPLPFVPQSGHRRSSHGPSDAFAPPSRVSRDSFPKTEHRDQRVGASAVCPTSLTRKDREAGGTPGPVQALCVVFGERLATASHLPVTRRPQDSAASCGPPAPPGPESVSCANTHRRRSPAPLPLTPSCAVDPRILCLCLRSSKESLPEVTALSFSHQAQPTPRGTLASTSPVQHQRMFLRSYCNMSGRLISPNPRTFSTAETRFEPESSRIAHSIGRRYSWVDDGFMCDSTSLYQQEISVLMPPKVSLSSFKHLFVYVICWSS